jgi:putative membrane protein
MRFLVRLLLNGLALVIADWFVPGISLSGPFVVLLAGAILGFVNAVVRPILLLLTLPLTLVTLGLFIFVVNALCLGLTAALVPGFFIRDFWSAMLGALVVSIVSWIVNGVLTDDERS